MNRASDAHAPETDDATIEPRSNDMLSRDASRFVRIGVAAICAGLGGFVLWAALAPLDEGVPAGGFVAVDTKRKSVQHAQGGIIRDVLVGEGQAVEVNQVLIRLEDAVARANYEASRQRYMGLRAIEGRLLAEQTGSTTIDFHPDLVAAAASDSSIRHHITAQVAAMQSRRESLAANVGAIDEAIQGQRAAIEGYAGILASRADQAALLEREISGVRGLVAEGYAPANKQMELERALADVAATIADLQANRARAQSGILELRQRGQALRSEYRKEVDMQLAEVRREVQSEDQRYRALREELGRTEIRAPSSGQVVGLAVQTVGGVVQAGQKLMDIVPLDARLVLEAHLATHLIDRVRPGAKVDVRFAAFAHSPQLVVEGKVDSISADALTDPITNVPYYLARVSITQDGQAALGTRRVQPGMPIEVIVKTGERSLLTYLLHPLIKRLSASMKEE